MLSLPRIPLIEELTTDPIPPGSNILVEYDPASLWYSASLTMTAGWLRSGGIVWYCVAIQPADEVRLQLDKLGLDTDEWENRLDKLRIFDWYACSLGQKRKEKYGWDSLKVADLSLIYAKGIMPRTPAPDELVIGDDESTLARFNDEKAWVEFELTRAYPSMKARKMTSIEAIMKGVHSESAYKKLESGNDVVLDFKLEEQGDQAVNLIRIRSMRNVHFDPRWHRLKIAENFEVILEK